MLKRPCTYKTLVANGCSDNDAQKTTDLLMKKNNRLGPPRNDHGQPLPYMANGSLCPDDLKGYIEDWVRYPALDQHGNVWA